MDRGDLESGEYGREMWPCVSCVSDTLRSHAGTISGRELDQAERRIALRHEAGQGLLRAMARRVAERIVDPAIRGLQRVSPKERPRLVAEIRETFGLDVPDGCPLNARAGLQARLSAVSGECPQVSAAANGERPPERQRA